MFTDDDRRHLYDDLEAHLGSRSAAILMAHLPPAGWAELATRADLDAQGVATRGEMAALGSELRGEMAQLRGEMGELKGELKGEIAELRAEVHSLLPKLIAANIASMIGVAGLVLAATSLAA